MKKLYFLTFCFFLTFFLIGCSLLNPGSGIGSQNQNADTVNNVINGYSALQYWVSIGLSFLVGFLLPNPFGMARKIISLWKMVP